MENKDNWAGCGSFKFPTEIQPLFSRVSCICYALDSLILYDSKNIKCPLKLFPRKHAMNPLKLEIKFRDCGHVYLTPSFQG